MSATAKSSAHFTPFPTSLFVEICFLLTGEGFFVYCPRTAFLFSARISAHRFRLTYPAGMPAGGNCLGKQASQALSTPASMPGNYSRAFQEEDWPDA